jgi:CubicO group peptidase (beta-lactamase class C family)
MGKRPLKSLCVLTFSLWVMSCARGGLATAAAVDANQTSEAYHYRQPPTLADMWVTGTLDDVGLDQLRIEQITDAIRRNPYWNLHAVLIEREGRLVYEEYFAGEDQRWGTPLGRVVFNRETKHDLRSVTKSVVSALLGIALHSGAIRSLDSPIVEYFPEYKELQTPERVPITIRHALSMTGGLEWNEDLPYTDPRNREIAMTRSEDPIRYVLSQRIVAKPGVEWRYNGGFTQLLAAVIQRTTGTSLKEYAQKMLFDPLGITDVEWVGDLAGLPAAASGLRLRPRDLAKFGSLYLHQGRWSHRQVLPAEWVKESTRRHTTFPNQASRGYAYQWWHTCYATPSGLVESKTAVGNGGQRVFVLPELKSVVTVLAGRYNDFSIAPWEQILTQYIIPSFHAQPTGRCPSE